MIRAIVAAVAVMLGGCSEGCSRWNEVDYEYRQQYLTLHRVEGACVVVGIFDDGDTAAIAAVPCPEERAK